MARPPLAVFLRSLTLESAWHRERLQGIGFLHALLPVLRRQSDTAEGVRRHAVSFNANVYAAPALLGAVARLEMEGEGEAGARLRDMLAPPLSGAADLYYWGALRPAVLGLGTLACVAGFPLMGLVVVLGGFNAAAAVARWRGFRVGVEAGKELVRRSAELRASRGSAARLRAATAFAAGALVSWGLVQARGGGGAALGIAVFDVGLGLFLGYHAARRQVSPGIAFLVLVVLGTLARRLDLSAWLR